MDGPTPVLEGRAGRVTLDAYASFSHYADHLVPVWRELDVGLRGQWGGPSGSTWATQFPRAYQRERMRAPLMVAGLADAQRFPGRPLVYVEHGAGQHYPGDVRSLAHGSYAGGKGLDQVGLFLCPNQDVADRWTTQYPARSVVVGCPKLDELIRNPRAWSTTVVAVSFHWDCPLIPETKSAYPHHQSALRPLADTLRAAGAQLVGHSHPRGVRQLQGVWGRLGVPYWRDARQVLRYADVLVCDNSSLMYEAAALGKPVVVLNAPWYRRDVHHGLRFWDYVPGVQVDNPVDVVDAVLEAVAHPEVGHDLRSRAVAKAYAVTDGTSSSRAARAVESWVESRA